MAQTQTVEDAAIPDHRQEEDVLRTAYRRLGLLNGLLIGLALAIGIWGPQVATLLRVPSQSPYGSLLLALILLLALTTLAGWLTARLAKGAITVLGWFMAAILVTLLMGYQPNWLRNFSVWIADPRFWGRVIFPPPEGTALGLIVGGFFVILALVLFAFLQDYRLENAMGALGPGRRIGLGAILRLSLPLPLVALAGLITSNIQGEAASPSALAVVDEAVRLSHDYEGDLFQLGLEKGINLGAMGAVRERLTDSYTLSIASIDPDMATTYVVATFDNGAWINCRVINDQLSYCFDASPPYTVGFSSLLTGESPPEDCPACLPAVDDSLAGWLVEKGQELGPQPQIIRVAQWGDQVLMRAQSSGGAQAIECWFEGISPVRVVNCQESDLER